MKIKGILHICMKLGRKCFFDPKLHSSCPYCLESFKDKKISEYELEAII